MNSTFTPTRTTNTRTIVINALFIALTLVVTMFIQIRLPLMGNGGLIHLGNVPLFIAALVYGIEFPAQGIIAPHHVAADIGRPSYVC